MAVEFSPYEMPAYDGSEDISDAWAEETDPEFERGELCEAFFDDWVRGSGCRCAVLAIRVSGIDGDRTVTMPRDMALRLLTPGTVARIERVRARDLDAAE